VEKRSIAFLASQAFVNIGDTSSQIAVFWTALSIGGSAISLGTLGAAWTLTMAVMGYISGSVADRFDRKTLLVVLESLLGFLSLIMFALASAGILSLWHLWVFLLAESILGTPFSFALSTMLPDLIGKERLLRVNAALGSWGQIDNLAEAAIAGIIIAAWGPAPIFLIHGVTFLVGAAGALLVRDPRKYADAVLPKWTLGEDLRIVVHFFRSNRVFLKNTILSSVGDLAYAPLFYAGPLVASVVGSGPEGYGFFESLMIAGTLATGLATTVLASRLPKAKSWVMGSLLFSSMFVVLGFWLSYPGALVAFFLIGVGLSGGRLFGKTLVQQALPSEVRGRISGIEWFVGGALQPISISLAMLLVDRGDLRWILVGLGAFLVCTALVRATILPLDDHRWKAHWKDSSCSTNT